MVCRASVATRLFGDICFADVTGLLRLIRPLPRRKKVTFLDQPATDETTDGFGPPNGVVLIKNKLIKRNNHSRGTPNTNQVAFPEKGFWPPPTTAPSRIE